MITAQTIGHGSRVTIWVHGWLRSSQMFVPLLSFMNRQAECWIFIDLPGYGENLKVPGSFNVDGAVMELIQFTEEAGIKQARWAGHSMGGLVIQRLAAKIPDRVSSLFGIAPVPIDGLRLNEHAEKVYRNACTSEEARFRVLTRLAGSKISPRTIRTWVAQSFDETREDALLTYLESWSLKRRESAALDLKTIPFVLVTGSVDPAITKSLIMESIAPLYRHFEIHILDGIGHLPVEEDTARVAQVLAISTK